jgi:uncharacterized membrane protein YeaQ/YmgE (transglycosylase-associated protein family)
MLKLEEDHMWIISTLIVGLIAGGLARLLVPGRDPMGCLMTAVLGIVGSFVGGGIAYLLGWQRGDGYFHTAGLLMSIVGAIIVLLIWRQFSRK